MDIPAFGGGLVIGIDSAINDAATWAAAVVGAYLTVGLLATIAATRAGAGRVPDAALRLYPRVARATMRSAVVATLSMGATVSGTAAAVADAPRPPVPPLVAPAGPPAEPLDWPTDRPMGPEGITHEASADVTVRPGDCLWRIAARSLGRRASPVAIATAWPRWWTVNRAAIGDDPDLLRPGLQLRAPRTLERSGS